MPNEPNDRHYFTDKLKSPGTGTGTRADMMAHATRNAVLCDYPGCVSWGSCPHSIRHEKVTEGGRNTYNLVCGTCPHDTNATCQRVEAK